MNALIPKILFQPIMPRPPAWTKYFLSGTILKLSRTKILSRVKKSIFWFPKLVKISICRWKWFFDTLPIRKFHFELILKEKMEFLTLDKNFVWDNFRFVQDKKYFVRADGRGICPKNGTINDLKCLRERCGKNSTLSLGSIMAKVARLTSRLKKISPMKIR